MSSERERTYHHGDLRRVILDAALDAIATNGPGALSLRDLARRAGVSHAAPAHHFKDRTGLLTAVAAEGYALFADALAGAPDLRERGVAYVRFAATHPAHFQVMFQPDLHRTDDPDLLAARTRAAEALRAGVAELPRPARARTTASPGWPPGPWPTASRRCCSAAIWPTRWRAGTRRPSSGPWPA